MLMSYYTTSQSLIPYVSRSDISAYGYYSSIHVSLWLIWSFYMSMLNAIPNDSKLRPSDIIDLLVCKYKAMIGIESRNNMLGIYVILMILLLNLVPLTLDEPNILHTDDFYTVLYILYDLLSIHCKS
jgi:hypothetical protein